MEDNANLNRVSQYSTFGPRYNSNNNNGSSTGYHPSGILKKPGVTSPPRIQTGDTDSEQYEARNDEVIRRVAEMKHILQVIKPDIALEIKSEYDFPLFIHFVFVLFYFFPFFVFFFFFFTIHHE